MKKSIVLGLLFMLLVSLFAAAQQTKTTTSASPEIKKYIWVSTGMMNPGKAKVFANLVRQIKDSAVSTNAEFYWLAGYGITGPGGAVSFVSFHDNLAEVDKALEVMEKVERAAALKNANMASEAAEAEQPGGHSMLAKYREDLSYNPTKVDAAHATRWSVSTIELRPGTMMDAENLIKEEIELIKKNNLDDHWLTYQVISGGRNAMLMIVTPFASLADMDAMEKQEEAAKAVFTPMVHKHFSAVIKDIVVSSSNNLFAVDPSLSRPTQQLVAANPDFWTVKEEPMVASRTGKASKKTGVEPAGMKEEKKK